MKIISLILYIWLFFLIVNLLARGLIWLVHWRLKSKMSSSKRNTSRSGQSRSGPSDTIIDAEFKEIE